MATQIKLKVIPAEEVNPKTMTILDGLANPGPLIKSEDADDPEYVCGNCGKVLLIGVQPAQVEGAVLQCWCRAYNDGTI